MYKRQDGTLVPEPLEPPEAINEGGQAAPTEFNVSYHGESYHIKVTGAGHKGQAERQFYFSVDGVPEEILIETLDEIVLGGGTTGAVAESIAGKRPAPSELGDVTTEMPGNIVEVLVSEGDEVEAGQPVLITEAMKMETEITAPVSGKVEAIYVQKDDAVNPKETLISIR